MEFLLRVLKDYTTVVTIEEKNWDEYFADGIILVGNQYFKLVFDEG
jgi:hypothetical protein